MNQSNTSEISLEVEQLLRNGEKIKAIGLYREKTGSDLATAKDAIEKYMLQNGISSEHESKGNVKEEKPTNSPSLEKIFGFVKTNSKKVIVISGAVILAIIVLIVCVVIFSNDTANSNSNEDSYKQNYNSSENESLSVDKYMPTIAEYIEKGKEQIPELNSLKSAYNDGKLVIYTNTGTLKYYTDSMQYNITTGSSQIALDWAQFFLQFEEGKLSIADKTSRSLPEILQYVEVLIGDYPAALTAEEIIKKYDEEATVLSGSKELNTEVDGIGYKIQISTTGNTKYIRITY